MITPHNKLVQGQFGATAAAYLSSPVHAAGVDLDRIAALAAACAPEQALDLGAGGGHVSYAIALHATRVTACDLSPEMLAVIEGEAAAKGLDNISTQAAAAERLPFPDAHFDFLACRFSAHHWGDIEAGLREARRVLRAGAPAIFVDVIAPASAAADTHLQAVELLRDPSHVRDYALREWHAMMARSGFAVAAVTPARLRMEFASWTARMRTPASHITAIRALQSLASAEVARHFAVERDGSFTIDTVIIEAR